MIDFANYHVYHDNYSHDIHVNNYYHDLLLSWLDFRSMDAVTATMQ